MPYNIEFATSTSSHFDSLTANQRSKVITGIEQHLVHDPMVETRNRKKLRPNPLAPWELRIGVLRVFYDVQESPVERETATLGSEQATLSGTVSIIAIGKKTGNVLHIAGKRIEL